MAKTVKACGLAVVIWVAAIPGTASAQVFVDPGTPAGQEYSVPFEQARHQGSGNQDFNAAPGADPTVPFGAGVTPPDRSEARGKTSVGAEALGELPSLSAGGGGIKLVVVLLVVGALVLAMGVATAARRVQRT